MAEHPEWIEKVLSREGADKIADAVKTSEGITSAEIVPMIVRRSTFKATGDRLIFWICFGLLGIGGAIGLSVIGSIDETLLEQVIEAMGLWPSATLYGVLAMAFEVITTALAFVIAYFGAKFLSRFDGMHRLVFPDVDERLACDQRALYEFLRSDLRNTKEKTGVLVFVSLLEHRAVVLADRKIAERLPESTWSGLLNELIGAIAAGNLSEGYCQAIEKIGSILAKEFPPNSDNRNELSDRLRILE